MAEEKAPLIGEVMVEAKHRRRITPMQWRFIDEYLIDMNGARSVIRAGYSRRGAKQVGSRLLRRPAIRDEIARRIAARSQRTAITADRVLEELARIAFANLMDYMRPGEGGDLVVDFSRLSRDQAAALVEVTVEDSRRSDGREVRRIRFKLADKLAALVALGRHLGMFVDKLEVTRNPFNEMSPAVLRALDEFLATMPDGAPEDTGGGPGAGGGVRH